MLWIYKKVKFRFILLMTQQTQCDHLYHLHNYIVSLRCWYTIRVIILAEVCVWWGGGGVKRRDESAVNNTRSENNICLEMNNNGNNRCRRESEAGGGRGQRRVERGGSSSCGSTYEWLTIVGVDKLHCMQNLLICTTLTHHRNLPARCSIIKNFSKAASVCEWTLCYQVTLTWFFQHKIGRHNRWYLMIPGLDMVESFIHSYNE